MYPKNRNEAYRNKSTKPTNAKSRSEHMVTLKGAMSKTSFTSTSRGRNNSTTMRAMGIFMIMYIVSNLKRIIDGFHNRLRSNRIGVSNMYNYFILIYFSISFLFFIYLFFTFLNVNVSIPSIMEVGKILNTLKIFKTCPRSKYFIIYG